MIPWFPIFMVGGIGVVAMLSGLASYVQNSGELEDEQAATRIVGGMVVIGAALICAMWNTGYMLGYLVGWWS